MAATRVVTAATLRQAGPAGPASSRPGTPGGELAAPDAGLVTTELVWEFIAAHPRRS
ncbi:hypothetical protein ACIBVK_09890 [Micromonospora echinofusca]|uniref:hypothetical protein n=1 Tax=Micromonospora echinofusca TaxID=47858 RepID=UPI00201FBA62|nr:hypothetical protein [Micromonospora sp. MSM11]MCL7458962.1 hypothetical protein [Micromonospora sp. MSM11]